MSKGGRRGWGIWDVAFVMVSVAALALSFWLHLRFGDGLLERISSDSMDIHADFDTFWQSAETVWTGGSVYDTGARLLNLNPPFWAVLLSPLALLEPLEAYRVFVLITLVMVVGYLAWMAGEVRLRGGWAVVAGVMLLLSSPLMATIALGQMYPVLALGLVAAWWADHKGARIASGVALGLTLAIKPTLAPVILWPIMRRRWDTLGAAIVSGAAATLVGAMVLGTRATMEYVSVLDRATVSGYWDNASIPGMASRLFTNNGFIEPVVALPGALPVAFTVGIVVVIVTAVRIARETEHGAEAGLWAMVAAALLASPVTWHNYLLLLGPGVILLLARGKTALAFLLLSLQFIPPSWPELWREDGTILSALALTLYTFILFAHWLAFLTFGDEKPAEPDPASDLSPDTA
ncbi:MAG: DUF2029 domain-containing protein [Rubrobacter sp.]|nr:DUF2029 domain-containing protein [Rubrobacter sp.]